MPLSTVDDPGRLAGVVFCQGCPWRCPYCHNPDLQPRHAAGGVPWRRVEELLVRRCGLLESVVFSGGEPTLQEALPEALDRVRRLGYRVGLHTAGIFPRRLAAILDRVDWVGLDVKAPAVAARRLTGSPAAARRTDESLRHVLRAASMGLDYEIRTTYHPALLGPEDLLSLGRTLARRGVRRWVVQRFRPQGCRDESLRAAPGAEVPPELNQRLYSLFEDFVLR